MCEPEGFKLDAVSQVCKSGRTAQNNGREDRMPTQRNHVVTEQHAAATDGVAVRLLRIVKTHSVIVAGAAVVQTLGLTTYRYSRLRTRKLEAEGLARQVSAKVPLALGTAAEHEDC